MKYFAFRVDTPFVGECADVYIEAESSDEAVVVAAECADENGMEWLGEMSEEEFRKTALEWLASFEWGKNIDEKLATKVCALMHSRTKVFADIAQWEYFFNDIPL